MSTSATLVATDDAADAEVVTALLRDEFSPVAVSSDPDRAVRDFEQHRPTVLILAFNGLEKAERYGLGLYRGSTLAHTWPHRTVVLCNKDDVRRAYELCRKSYFDDYVLFWPMNYDAPRLCMAVHHAVRQLAAAAAPTPAEFAAQARRIGELDGLVQGNLTEGGARVETARRSMREAQSRIGAALDDFSRRLSDGSQRDGVEVKDRVAFEQAMNRLKAHDIERPLQSAAMAIEPVHEWTGALKRDFEPALESARALRCLAERVRPLVLVVDDDEFQHKYLLRALADAKFDLAFATSGAEMFAVVHKRLPDLVLMDVDMPDIGGVEVTRRLKALERYAAIPVVMITGHSGKQVVVESLRAGAADFIVKPIDRKVLLGKLRAALGTAA